MILIASSINVQTIRKRPAAGMYLKQAGPTSQQDVCFSAQGYTLANIRKDNSLFYRIRRGIQPILDFVCLLSELLQWTGIIGCICPARSSESIILRPEVVTRRAPYLSHGCCSLLIQRKITGDRCADIVKGRHFLRLALGKMKKSNECLSVYLSRCFYKNEVIEVKDTLPNGPIPAPDAKPRQP